MEEGPVTGPSFLCSLSWRGGPFSGLLLKPVLGVCLFLDPNFLAFPATWPKTPTTPAVLLHSPTQSPPPPASQPPLTRPQPQLFLAERTGRGEVNDLTASCF